MQPLAIAASLTSLLVAGIHIYWGHGGFWPGTTKQDLVDKVFGQGTEFPGLVPCYFVALGFLFAALVPLVSTALVEVPQAQGQARALVVLIGSVLMLRGALGYLPALERRWTPVFVALNRRIYGPLCLGLSAAYFAIGLGV